MQRLALTLALALTGLVLTACSLSDYKAPDSFTVSDSAVTDAVKGALKSSGSPGLDGAPDVACTGRRYCAIDYTVKETTGISTNIELVQPTRQLWKALFTDPKFKSGVITVNGPTTSVGGKSGTGALFTLSCDRPAARQIDWDNVDGKGVRALCRFAPKVSGL